MRGGRIELFTSRWANRELAHLQCKPVGISRGVPRWRTPYRWKLLRDLAPSREAFAIEDWDAFAAAYRAGLKELGTRRSWASLRGSAGRPEALRW